MNKQKIKVMADVVKRMTLEEIEKQDKESPTILTKTILGIFKTAKITGIDYYTYRVEPDGYKVFVELKS
jgi:hypothetical protein